MDFSYTGSIANFAIQTNSPDLFLAKNLLSVLHLLSMDKDISGKESLAVFLYEGGMFILPSSTEEFVGSVKELSVLADLVRFEESENPDERKRRFERVFSKSIKLGYFVYDSNTNCVAKHKEQERSIVEFSGICGIDMENNIIPIIKSEYNMIDKMLEHSGFYVQDIETGTKCFTNFSELRNIRFFNPTIFSWRNRIFKLDRSSLLPV